MMSSLTYSAAPGTAPPFCSQHHVNYINSLTADKTSIVFYASEHLRMGGVYWGLSALDLMGRLSDHSERRQDVVEWILKCQKPDGGFSPDIGHDAHITSTHYAILALTVCDALDAVDIERVANYVSSLQNPDGSFSGDKWGEVDTRYSYCGLSCLTILDRMYKMNVPSAAEFIRSCRNADGGFGWVPGSESHAASAFCCVAGLALAETLHFLDRDQLGLWLCQRQTAGGGFNGRPEKAPDVCYSWWILSALVIIDRLDWINKESLATFILLSQDTDEGGIADRPGDVSDVFHTFFGMAGLALLRAAPNLKAIHPVYALPTDVVKRVGLPMLIEWRT